MLKMVVSVNFTYASFYPSFILFFHIERKVMVQQHALSEVLLANSTYSKRSVPLRICFLKCGDFMIIAAHSVDAQRFISVVSLFFIMSQNFSKPQSR